MGLGGGAGLDERLVGADRVHPHQLGQAEHAFYVISRAVAPVVRITPARELVLGELGGVDRRRRRRRRGRLRGSKAEEGDEQREESLAPAATAARAAAQMYYNNMHFLMFIGKRTVPNI